MNRIKDAFYDKNDILIALVILCIAVFVIFFKVEAIMEYPKTLAASSSNQVQDPVAIDPTITDPIATDPISTDPVATDPVATDTAVDSVPEVCSVYINSGDSMQTIGANLVSAGFFSSVEEFVQLISDKGVSTQVRMGNHIIPSNATQDEVIEYIIQPGL